MDSIHRPSPTSAAERLNAFRQPAGAPSAAHRIAIGKNEVLMGVVVVFVGILLLGFLVFRPDKNQTVIGTIEAASEITPTSAPQLLEGEAFVALAVEPGRYPPQLKVGDVVQIAVTPGIDGNGKRVCCQKKQLLLMFQRPATLRWRQLSRFALRRQFS